jgi:hypothetical protein
VPNVTGASNAPEKYNPRFLAGRQLSAAAVQLIVLVRMVPALVKDTAGTLKSIDTTSRSDPAEQTEVFSLYPVGQVSIQNLPVLASTIHFVALDSAQVAQSKKLFV